MSGYLVLLSLAVAGAVVPAWAEDWVTSDGQSYHDVKVMSHNDGYVTVLDSDGGARVLLRTLGPDLQKRFGYEAVKAAACEAATIAADKHDHQALVSQQALAVQAGSVPPAMSNVAAGPATPVIMHGPAAPKKPTVDTWANTEKIDDDKKALEDLEIDIRDAQREQTRNYEYGDSHYDNSGTLHPNTVGESPQDRLAKFKKKKKDLQEEIKDLEAQNAAAGQPAQ